MIRLRTGCLAVAWIGLAVVADFRAAAAPCRVFRFDMGTATSPVKEGWTQVTREMVYTPERGYGWQRPAARG